MRALAAGVLGHLVLLLGPLLFIEGRLPREPTVWAFVALATVFCVVEAGAAHPTREAGKAEAGGWLPAVTGLALLTVFLAALLGRGAGSAAGAVLIAGGVALRWAAMRQLGQWFVSEVRLLPGHELVTGGVYRWVRHPSELGLLAIALGAAVLLGSRAAGVGVVGLALLVLWRVRVEDRMLALHFPRAFTAWAREVPALLPRWRP
jgi:protein-S-isoprenylcysteine O-methyltransferase Ste14